MERIADDVNWNYVNLNVGELKISYVHNSKSLSPPPINPPTLKVSTVTYRLYNQR